MMVDHVLAFPDIRGVVVSDLDEFGSNTIAGAYIDVTFVVNGRRDDGRSTAPA